MKSVRHGPRGGSSELECIHVGQGPLRCSLELEKWTLLRARGGCKCKTWPPWGSSELGENIGPYGGWMLLRAGGGGNVVPLR